MYFDVLGARRTSRLQELAWLTGKVTSSDPEDAAVGGPTRLPWSQSVRPILPVIGRRRAKSEVSSAVCRLPSSACTYLRHSFCRNGFVQCFCCRYVLCKQFDPLAFLGLNRQLVSRVARRNAPRACSTAANKPFRCDREEHLFYDILFARGPSPGNLLLSLTSTRLIASDWPTKSSAFEAERFRSNGADRYGSGGFRVRRKASAHQQGCSKIVSRIFGLLGAGTTRLDRRPPQ